jgi:DNA-binding MarR family transcriptional regulator
MDNETLQKTRKLSQRYAYASIQMHEAIARKAGLPGTDHKYLAFIMERGKMTAGELCELTGLTSGAVTGLIDRFEKKKLVKRASDDHDRRKVFIVPNSKNIMDLFVPLYKDFRNRSNKLLGSFSNKEIEAIEKYFTNAIAIMQDTTEKMNKK